MAGYVRQSIADIINGESVTAPPLNAEFDQIQSAFNSTGGHSHDGSTGNSKKIDLTTSITGYLPVINGGVGGKNTTTQVVDPAQTDDGTSGYAAGSVWINTSTDKIFICFSNASGAAVWHEVAAITPQNRWTPALTGLIDIGSPTKAFKDVYVNGSYNGVVGGITPAAVTATTVTANTGFSGNLTGNVTGDITGDVTGDVTGDLTGNFTGNATGDLTGNLVATTTTAKNFNPATDSTYTLGTTTIRWSNIFADAAEINTVTGDVIGDLTGNLVATTTTVKNFNPASDNAYTLGTTTARWANIFANAVTGDLVGNVTGNVTGNLTGNVTGDIVGSINASNAVVSNVATPVATTDAANKQYVTDQLSLGVNSVEAFRLDAQKFAINAEDNQFTSSTGITGYSALHYAAKADDSKVAAASSATAASASEVSAAASALTASTKAALLSNAADAIEHRLIGVLI